LDGAALVDADDPRFTGLLEGHRNLAEWGDRVRDDPSPWAGDQYYQVVAWLQQRQGWTLEEEGLDLLGAAVLAAGQRDTARWTEALTRRYGLDGQPPGTLDDVGRRAGVTRERARQVQRKVEAAIPPGPRWAPVAEQAVRLASSLAPATLDDLHAAMVGAGLSRLTWTYAGLAATLALTGRRLDLVALDGALLPPEDAHHWQAALQTLRRVSGSHGTASVDTVLTRLHGDGRPAPEGVVQLAMTLAPGVHGLTGGHVWCDHPRGRNRLVNASLRILTVHSPQTLASMHEGVRRNFTWRASTGGDRDSTRDLEAPQLDVLDAFYRSHPAFTVDADGMVDAVELLDAEDLGEEKWAMVQVLRSFTPPAADRNTLVDACVEAGVNAGTAGVLLTYGECFEKLGHNVWGLRGVGVPNDAVAALQAGARARRDAFDKGQVSGSTPSGRPWVARRMSPDVVRSGVLPANFHPGVLQDAGFTVVDASDGETLGRLRRSEAFAYGLARLMIKHRPAVGATVRLTFYSDDMSVLVELGDDGLLGEPPDLG
jgi:hypothetical protein